MPCVADNVCRGVQPSVHVSGDAFDHVVVSSTGCGRCFVCVCGGGHIHAVAAAGPKVLQAQARVTMHGLPVAQLCVADNCTSAPSCENALLLHAVCRWPLSPTLLHPTTRVSNRCARCFCRYPTTVATASRRARDVIEAAFETSVEGGRQSPLVLSRLHDFGFRGCCTVEQSVLGGCAHLLNFDGTDTMSAAYYAQFHLNGGRPVGMSIPATEHRYVCACTHLMWGLFV